MSLVSVDESLCRRDGICVAVCPARLIELREDSPVPTSIPDAELICIRCGHCVAACPHGALSHATIHREDCPPVRPELALGADQVEHVLRSRRSVRVYRDKPVEREKIAELIRISRYAPTGSNRQPVRWFVVDSREQVREIAGRVIDVMKQWMEEKHPFASMLNAPFLVKAWESGRDPIARDAPALVIAHTPGEDMVSPTDAVIALSFFDLAAPAFGLGACWCGYLMRALPESASLRQTLGLPEGPRFYGVLMVGYPKYRYHRLPPRNEPRIAWHERGESESGGTFA